MTCRPPRRAANPLWGLGVARSGDAFVAGLLDAVKVLDVSRVLAGPYCSMLLADLGAEVVKVEEPRRGDDTRDWGPPFLGGESAYFLSVNRNKKSLTLDLKHPEGREILLALAAQSDVLLENFSPGTASRLGLSFEDVSQVNPRIVYCSVSGFGQDGPYRDLPAYDLILQGMGGLQAITGEPGRPPLRVGVAVADLAGGMFAALAIAAALFRRTQTGRGEHIDVSLLDGQLAWLTYMAGVAFATGKDPEPAGSKHPTIVPYQAFETSDGYVNLTVGNDAIFRRLCEAVGRPEVASDPRFAANPARVENRDALEDVLENLFAQRSTGAWLDILRANVVPTGPVLRISDIARDPHVLARGNVLTLQHPTAGAIRQFGPPIRPREARGPHTPPPRLGEHTDEVLESIGVSSAKRAELRRARVV